MNNKGFSLTELIVTFVIMGIIMGMAFPAVGRLQKQNKTQLYQAYETAMEKAAKLYVDQYEIDLWGKSEYGCVKIDYNTLACEKLIKEYKSNGKEQLAKNDSYVYVTKNNDGTFSYQSHIKLVGTNLTYESKELNTTCKENPNKDLCQS